MLNFHTNAKYCLKNNNLNTRPLNYLTRSEVNNIAYYQQLCQYLVFMVMSHKKPHIENPSLHFSPLKPVYTNKLER